MFSSVSERFAKDLQAGIVNQNDPMLVADGLPSYLLLLDGMLQERSRDPGLLFAAADLNAAYASQFTDEPARNRRLSNKALNYALQAVCLSYKAYCEIRTLPLNDLKFALAQSQSLDVSALYTLATTWAGWIQAHASDWNAIAELSRVEALLTRIIELDPSYQQGGAHLYLGVIKSLIPPAAGGRPDEAKAHFEQAIFISEERNLMAKVLYAKHYARLMFDQQLHDQLLTDVLSAEANVTGLTLINTLAQRQARELLTESPDYF